MSMLIFVLILARISVLNDGKSLCIDFCRLWRIGVELTKKCRIMRGIDDERPRRIQRGYMETISTKSIDRTIATTQTILQL
jgi:hypothetical protein